MPALLEGVWTRVSHFRAYRGDPEARANFFRAAIRWVRWRITISFVLPVGMDVPAPLGRAVPVRAFVLSGNILDLVKEQVEGGWLP